MTVLNVMEIVLKKISVLFIVSVAVNTSSVPILFVHTSYKIEIASYKNGHLYANKIMI